MTSSNPNCLLQTPPLKTITRGDRVQQMNFGRYTGLVQKKDQIKSHHLYTASLNSFRRDNCSCRGLPAFPSHLALSLIVADGMSDFLMDWDYIFIVVGPPSGPSKVLRSIRGGSTVQPLGAGVLGSDRPGFKSQLSDC